MYNAKQIVVSIFFLLSLSAFGQKAEKAYQRGEDFFYTEMLEAALTEYQAAMELQPGYKDAEYKAEICSLLTISREKPIDKLIAYGETFGKKDKFYQYWLGRVLVREYRYEEAKSAFSLFLEGRGKKSSEIIKETKDFIEAADKRLNFFYNTDNYEIHKLEPPINTVGAELTPAFFVEKEELLFASNRSANGPTDEFNIYHAIKKDDRWTDITEITILGEFTRENANVEVVDEDGKLFIFDQKKGDLFYSESRNGKWVRPVEFDTKLKAAHIQSHFFINEHEDRIIFSTFAEGKKRVDLDLYQTFKDPATGKWSKPAPFNLMINSEMDEDSPYLTPDEKTLYFSSDGHGSIGGLDIYKSELDPETLKWSEPINLGFPINSPDDEVHFKMNPDGKGGYFSSNRLHTTGDFDIYFFWEVQKIKIEGRAFDLSANQAISSGMIRFTPSQYSDEHFRSELNEKGQYSTEIIADETYLVEIIKDGETLFTDEFEIHETGGLTTTYLKDFMFNNGLPVSKIPARIEDADRKSRSTKPPIQEAPKTKSTEPSRRPNQNTARDATITTVQDLPKNYSTGRKAILDNIYFDFGTSGLAQGSNQVLTELLEVLKKNVSLKIEIGGHTDNVGSASVNLWLSQRRAETVKNWLSKRGINSDRMVAKGYGETMPLASNDDEEEGRELNRRIEIFVIR